MQAIVLRRRDAGENDRIVSFLTKERGKVEAFAKGVKKITGKNGPFLEPFFFVEAETVPGKEADKLIRAYPLASFVGIRSDLGKMRLAGYAAQFIDATMKTEEKHEKIFDIYLSWLIFLDKASGPRINSLYALMIKICFYLGFAPQLSACAHCGKALAREYKKIFFSVTQGGIVCSSCRADEGGRAAVSALSAAEYKWLRTLLQGSWELVNKLKKEPFEPKMRRLIFNFIQYRLEKKLAEFSDI